MNTVKKFSGIFGSLLVLAYLILIVSLFYFFDKNFISGNFALNIIIFSLLVDGVYLLLHIFRRSVKHKNLSFDPNKLTVLIACYNGQDIISETLENALKKVKAENIIVVSDASTDRTAEVARKYGVRVFENERNVNKAFSISFIMHQVKTPYVLILDDDTLIGDTFIPTNLLDEGYSAVAFNVMPVETGSLINKLQTFEYRKSMSLSKSLRGNNGAIGNISGAIGLYRTKDLLKQVKLHSGQFGGEDQQRTSFVHLYGEGKGITYTDNVVRTKVPSSLRKLIKQRSMRWNLSQQELFVTYFRIMLSANLPFILKAEKAYQIYLLLTDPIRMVFFWVLFTNPLYGLIVYIFYFILTLIVWIRIGRQDPFWVIVLFPIYSMGESICRFIAHFYWLKIKFDYIFRNQYHKFVTGRNLLREYTLVMLVLFSFWTMTVLQFNDSFLTPSSNRITVIAINNENSSNVSQNETISQETIKDTNVSTTTTANQNVLGITQTERSEIYYLTANKGDSLSRLTRRAINSYSKENQLKIDKTSRIYIEANLVKELGSRDLVIGEEITIESKKIESLLNESFTLNDEERNGWAYYSSLVDFSVFGI